MRRLPRRRWHWLGDGQEDGRPRFHRRRTPGHVRRSTYRHHYEWQEQDAQVWLAEAGRHQGSGDVHPYAEKVVPPTTATGIALRDLSGQLVQAVDTPRPSLECALPHDA